MRMPEAHPRASEMRVRQEPSAPGETGTAALQRKQEGRDTQVSPLWARLVATFCGVGYLRPGPGTWASAVTLLLWWLGAHWVAPGWRPWTPLLVASIAVLAGIPAATRVARTSGLRDPQFIVIDEVAGQLLAVIAAPVTWQSLLLGFILFRGFDIVKPSPLRRLERLPEGMGIVIDDVGAGVYSWVMLQAVLRLGVLPR